MKRLYLSLVLLAVLVPGISAAEPDFLLLFKDCKILLGSLKNGSLNVAPGDPPTFGCSRQAGNMICMVTYPSGGKSGGSPTESFKVLLDSPPFLYFSSANNAEFFSINMQTRAVVLTARMTNTTYTGEKVCVGLFTTSSELKLFPKKQKEK